MHGHTFIQAVTSSYTYAVTLLYTHPSGKTLGFTDLEMSEDRN